MLKSALAKAATAKAAIILAAVGGGGVALTAGSGHLPGVAPSNDHATSRPSARVTAGGHAAEAAAAHGSSGAAGHRSSSRVAHGNPSGAAPHTAPLRQTRHPRRTCAVCARHSRLASATTPGKALNNPAFTVLINTAGGKDGVANHCTTVLAPPADAASTHAPRTSHGRPTTGPGNASSSHPTGPEHTRSHREPIVPPTHAHN